MGRRMKLSLRCEGYGLLEDGRAVAIIRIFEAESRYQIQILNVVRVFSQGGTLGPWVDPTVYRDLETAKRDGTTPIRNKLNALARAVHAIQDSYPSGHQYQYWYGGHTPLHIPSIPHIKGDANPIPAAEAATYEFLNALRNGMLGSAEGYLFPRPSNCR